MQCSILENQTTGGGGKLLKKNLQDFRNIVLTLDTGQNSILFLVFFLHGNVLNLAWEGAKMQNKQYRNLMHLMLGTKSR